jgi:hypothetical protein
VIDCRAPFFGSFFGEAKKEQLRTKELAKKEQPRHEG